MGKNTVDLDRDVTINGHTFAAGKGVSTVVQEPDPDDDNGGTMDVDYGEAIRDVLKANREAIAFAGKHHGEVKPGDSTATTSSSLSGNRGQGSGSSAGNTGGGNNNGNSSGGSGGNS